MIQVLLRVRTGFKGSPWSLRALGPCGLGDLLLMDRGHTIVRESREMASHEVEMPVPVPVPVTEGNQAESPTISFVSSS